MYSVGGGGGSNFQNLKVSKNSGEGCAAAASLFNCLVNFKISNLRENWNEIKVYLFFHRYREN